MWEWMKRFRGLRAGPNEGRKLRLSPSEQLAEALLGRALAAERALERANAREAELVAQIRMVMEERFYRPAIAGRREQPAPSAVAIAALKGDGDMGDEAMLMQELAEIRREHEGAQRA